MPAKSKVARALRRALFSSSAAALALALSHQAAQAQVYDVTFNGFGISGSAIVLTNGAGSGNYRVANYITGTITDSNTDGVQHSITGMSNYRVPDQYIQAPGTPYFDNHGMAFSTNAPQDSNYILGYLSSQYVIGHSVGGTDEVSFGMTETATVHPSIDTAQSSYDENSTPLAQSTVVFDGGTFKPTTGYTLSAPVIISSAGGTVDATNGTVYFSGAISGPGGLTVTGGGVALDGALSYTGGTTINSGAVLALQTPSSILPGNLLNNGYLQVEAVGNATYSGVISGSGGVQVANAGSTFTLTGANTDTGTMFIYAGSTVQIGNGGASGAWAGNIANAGSLVFNRSDTTTFSGTISDFNGGSGSLTQAGSGTLILTGNNSYTGGTTINAGGTLQLGNGGTSGSVAGDIVDNGTLVFDRSDTTSYSGAISGSGGVTIGGTGTVVLSGVQTYTGTTTVNSGATLQLGDGAGNAGLLAGAITDNGLISFNAGTGTLVDYATAITGTGGITVASGTLELTGVNTFTGTTTVNSGATLQLGDGAGTMGLLAGAITDNGKLVFNGGSGTLTDFVTGITGSGDVTVASGTIQLSGNNTYTGLTTVDAGATLQLVGSGSIASSGDPLVNGTFDISGASGDVSVVSLSGSGSVLLGSNTLVLTNASDTFSGGISGAGGLTIAGGTETLSGVNTFTGTTTINSGATLRLGDGAGNMGLLAGAITNNGSLVFDGGSGTLTLYATGVTGSGDVTLASGTLQLSGNNTYTGSTSIASGATLQLVNSGSIAASSGVADDGTFDISGANGGVSIKSLSGSGSVALGANTMTLTNASGTFSGAIGGTGGLIIAGGTETLSGVNTFTGTTTINSGATLKLGDGAGNMGLLAGPITDNGSLVFNGGSGTLTLYATGITGSGDATVASGTLELTGTNTYSGATTINSGATLQLGAGGSTGSVAGNIVDNGALAFNYSGNGPVYGGAISGTGGVTTVAGIVTLTGDSTYTGGTTINSGSALVLGAGGTTGSVTGDIHSLGGTLAFYHSNTVTYGGVYSGTGNLVIEGTGTAVLTGTNTSTGLTSVLAGATLQLGNGGAAGSVAGNIADAGTVVFDHGANVAYAGVISGSGAVSVAPTGYGLYFTGANTYTGGTTVGAGTALYLGNGGTSGSIVGDVVLNGGDLVFDRSDNVTFSGKISGSAGWITLKGGDTVTLTADNTFTGPPNVQAGSTLQLGNGGTTGSVASSAINDFGAVVFDHSNTLTWSGVIQQSGSVTIGGTGTVVFTGANTYTGGTTINAGASLRLGGGSTTGSIVGDVLDNGALTFNRADTVTFAGSIAGSGALLQTGSGTTILNGDNTVSGLTTVSAGTLEIGDAAHPGAVLDSHVGGVNIGANGTLMGHGKILGAVTNTSGGVVSPGGSIGTLTVGSYTQGANSTLAIEVSPTQASQLNVTGAASLNGKLSLVFDPGTYSPHSYEILAAGSVSGTFSNVDASGVQAGLIYGLAYKSDQVDLVLAPTRNALVYGDVSTATLDRAQSFASFVEDRFSEAVCANGAADKPHGGDDACHGMGAWAQAIASSDRAGGLGGGYGFNNKGAGFIGGIDHRWAGGATLGVAFGYQDNSLSISEASTSATGHAYFGSVYGRWTVGPVDLDGQAYFMNSDWSLSRNIPGSGKASSRPNGDTEGFLVQASAPIGQSGVTPYVRLAFAQFNRDGVTESGAGPIGYAIASASTSSTLGEIGLTYAHVYGEAGGRQLVPSLRLGLQKDFSSRSQTVDASLNGVSGSAFAVSYDKPGQTAGVADLSLKAQLTPSFQLTGELRGRFGDSVSEGAATVGGAYRF